MARKKKVTGVQTVTRIAQLGTLKVNKHKLEQLDTLASCLGSLRTDLWNEFGSLKAWGVSEYDIDKLLRLTNSKYNLPAKLWEATLYDVITDIHTVQASCIEKVLRVIGLRYTASLSKKSVAQHVLESREWLNHPRLKQLVRKFYRRGHTKVNNQIVIKAYDCKTDANGVVWIKFGGINKGRPIKLPTTLPQETKCQLRLIKRGKKWEIHYTIDITVAPKRTEGLDIAVDRGHTEVYATSSNDGSRFIGKDFGKIQNQESDYRTDKGKKRNKLRSVLNKALEKGNTAKADRIKVNNLGRIKWNNRESAFKGRIKTLVFTATVQLMHDAIKSVAYEDLTKQFSSKAKRSRRTKRNLNTWCKGVVQSAITQVSSRVGCTVTSVNACYTSQLDSRFGVLLGTRSGDKFIGFDGVVLQADTNAADNVLARSKDDEISIYLKHNVAKEILLARTQKFLDNLGAQTDKDKSQTLDTCVACQSESEHKAIDAG